MKKTFNQIFVLRKLNTNEEAGTIYLKMTINGERTEFSLQRQCESARLLPNKGSVNGKTEEVKFSSSAKDYRTGRCRNTKLSKRMLLDS